MKSLKFIPVGWVISLLPMLVSCAMIYEEPASSSNSLHTLRIKNYLGNTENIHPKVLYFPQGWNGFEFWMAYTPYPKGDIDAENPCIAVSHDGISWSTPEGLINPLASARKNHYNSDTHLVYNSTVDKLECWWREYDIPSNTDAIYRRVSSDGVHWQEAELILPDDEINYARLSPAVWIEEGEYRMVYSNGRRLFLIRAEAGSSLDEWTSPVELPIDWDNLSAWHHDLILDVDGRYKLIVCAFETGVGDNNTADLYFVTLNHDFEDASAPVRILSRGSDPDDFDFRSIYRSSVVRVGEEYFVYYSAISKNWTRAMALLRGYDLTALRQLTDEEMGCE